MTEDKLNVTLTIDSRGEYSIALTEGDGQSDPTCTIRSYCGGATVGIETQLPDGHTDTELFSRSNMPAGAKEVIAALVVDLLNVISEDVILADNEICVLLDRDSWGGLIIRRPWNENGSGFTRERSFVMEDGDIDDTCTMSDYVNMVED